MAKSATKLKAVDEIVWAGVDMDDDVDWSHECAGYFVFYDPVIVDDGAMDAIAAGLERDQWSRAEYKELVKPISPYALWREQAALALIPLGSEWGVGARITTGELTAAEKREFNATKKWAGNREAVRWDVPLRLTGPRLGMTWTWIMGFPCRQRRELFHSGYVSEIDVDPGDYQLDVYSGAFRAKRQEYTAVVRLIPATLPASRGQKRAAKKTAKRGPRLAVDGALKLNAVGLVWLQELCRLAAQRKVHETYAALNCGYATGSLDEPGGRREVQPASTGCATAIARKLQGGEQSCVWYATPPRSSLQIAIGGRSKAGKFTVDQIEWTGYKSTAKSKAKTNTNAKAQATPIAAETLESVMRRVPKEAPDSDNPPDVFVTFTDRDAAHRAAVRTRELGGQPIWWDATVEVSLLDLSALLLTMAEDEGDLDAITAVRTPVTRTKPKKNAKPPAAVAKIQADNGVKGAVKLLERHLVARIKSLNAKRLSAKDNLVYMNLMFLSPRERVAPYRMDDPGLADAFAKLNPEQQCRAVQGILAETIGEPIEEHRPLPESLLKCIEQTSGWQRSDVSRLKSLFKSMTTVRATTTLAAAFATLDRVHTDGLMSEQQADAAARALFAGQRAAARFGVTAAVARRIARYPWLDRTLVADWLEQHRLAAETPAQARTLSKLSGELKLPSG